MKNLLIVILLFSCISIFASGVQPSGTGTSEDPYQVASLNNLLWICSNNTSWDKFFIQTENIDASDTQTWNFGAGFYPIGNEGTKFSGNYNGAGYSVDGLYIYRFEGDYVGLFGYTDGCTIQNIGVTNMNIIGRYYVGGLAGYNYNDSDISNSYSTGTVSGTSKTGGLIGVNENSDISKSFSTGTVTGSTRTGGLVGHNFNASNIENSYSTGSVSGSLNTGGLVGINESGSNVSNSYSTGSVNGTTNVGGLAGYNYNSSVSNSFWDLDTSGQATSAAGIGKTTAEMQNMATFTDAGWDFMDETTNGGNDYWGINFAANNAYPFLEWQGFTNTGLPYSAGTGTELDPYQIANLNDLEELSLKTTDWATGIYFIQTADIDAADTQNWNSGAGFSPIGNEGITFNGNYNGAGYTIDGLYINLPATNKVGLFNYTLECTIQNVGVTNVNIFGQLNVGGLVGMNAYSNISNSYSTGSVNGRSQVGGLVGYNDHSYISNSYSTGSVIGSGHMTGQNVGGLVGYNDRSNISNSYSTGSVNGMSQVGGLVGYNYVSPISNCFWDTQTSGQATSDGGTGKTTAEMKTLATFTEAGWDFMGETVNGIDDIWGINGAYNSGYPFLLQTGCVPVIISVSDVPGDQGRHIIATWSKSSFDDYNQNTPISSYNLWIEYPFEARGYNVTSDINEYLQFVSNHTKKSTDNTKSQEILKPFEMVDHSHNNILKASVPEILFEREGELWLSVGVTNAMQWDSYAMAAMTFRDFSLTEDNYSRFFVSAHTAIPSLYFCSIPVNGYSVDNIPPNAAANVAVTVSNTTRNNILTISWDAVSEGSYQGNSYPEQNGVWYKIYASHHPDFICDETTYLNTTQNTILEIDVSSEEKMFFKIIVSDME